MEANLNVLICISCSQFKYKQLVDNLNIQAYS